MHQLLLYVVYASLSFSLSTCCPNSNFCLYYGKTSSGMDRFPFIGLPDDMSADCGLYIHRKLPVSIISIAYNSIWNRHFQIAFYCFLNVDAKRSIEDQFLYAIRRNISIHAVLLGCVCRQCLFSCACPFYFHLFLYVCDVDWITWIFEIPAGCNIATTTTTTPCVCGSPPSPHLVGTSHCVCVHERGLLSIEPK